MSLRIDAHQHFWHYDPAAYPWIEPGWTAIRRDRLPGDLRPELDAAAIDGCIAVQARTTVDETTWLLRVAAEHPWVVGVVGWLPLHHPDVAAAIEIHAADPKLVGLRHVLQAEPEAWFVREDFNQGIAAAGRAGLNYDILITAGQLPAAIELADRHPRMRLVVDHLAKPDIRSDGFDAWAEPFAALARREHVACKLSGVVTEADHAGWSPEGIRPYLDHALRCFGPERLLFGSDWPVCTVAASYRRWVEVVTAWANEALNADQRAALMGGNAQDWYQLPQEAPR